MSNMQSVMPRPAAPHPAPDRTPPRPAAPHPVAPRPVAPRPAAPHPVAPRPVAPRPAAPHPVAPRPVAPRPAPDRTPPPPAAPRPAPDRPPVRSPREPLAGVVHELRVLLLERQHDVPHRPVPMLGDDDVRLAGPLGILVVVLLAIDEHHEVRVLLD